MSTGKKAQVESSFEFVGMQQQKISFLRPIWKQRFLLTVGGVDIHPYALEVANVECNTSCQSVPLICRHGRLILSTWLKFVKEVQIPLDGAPCQVCCSVLFVRPS